MKSFLIMLFFVSSAFAQSTATVSSRPTNTSSFSLPTLNWEKIKSKMRINYFSETLGPSLNRWDDNEIGDDGTKQPEPTTMYHSFNVRFLTGKQFNLFMSPRFATVFGDRNDLRPTQDDNVLMMDDWQFGIMYTFIATPTFNYNQSLTHRQPFSVKSKNENIDSQVEWNHMVNWAIKPSLRLLHWTNFRHYQYNDEGRDDRYRVNFRNILVHTFNDKWSAQLSYELDLQHRNPKDPSNVNYKEMNYMKRYHSYTSVAVGYTPIPNWTFLPFIRTVDERNIRNETTILGLWVLGRVI